MTAEGRECVGSGDVVLEGESMVYSLTYPAAITVDANSFMTAYRGSSDVSSTVLSGSLAGDGTTTLTLKTISGEVGASGGADYIYSFGVTCQGVRNSYWFRRVVMRKSLR